MSHDSDLAEGFRAMRDEKKARHERWGKENRAAIFAAGLTPEPWGDALCFRDKARNKSADFYPSTGRWRDHKALKTYSGGAKAFIAWWGTPINNTPVHQPTKENQ